jgi:hypothetical protein
MTALSPFLLVIVNIFVFFSFLTVVGYLLFFSQKLLFSLFGFSLEKLYKRNEATASVNSSSANVRQQSFFSSDSGESQKIENVLRGVFSDHFLNSDFSIVDKILSSGQAEFRVNSELVNNYLQPQKAASAALDKNDTPAKTTKNLRTYDIYPAISHSPVLLLTTSTSNSKHMLVLSGKPRYIEAIRPSNQPVKYMTDLHFQPVKMKLGSKSPSTADVVFMKSVKNNEHNSTGSKVKIGEKTKNPQQGTMSYYMDIQNQLRKGYNASLASSIRRNQNSQDVSYKYRVRSNVSLQEEITQNTQKKIFVDIC